MIYFIRQINSAPKWDCIAPIYINEYSWGGNYRPKSTARLCYWKESGFFLQMTCKENNPRRVYTQSNDPVYKDSCLEFFVNFKPQQAASGYLNFECNANGTLLCEYGKNKENRNCLSDLGVALPEVISIKKEDIWGYELFIPLSLIRSIYGNSMFRSGDILTGNFYKCGDDTQIPHYASWTKINSKEPNFHLPSYFGTLKII